MMAYDTIKICIVILLHSTCSLSSLDTNYAQPEIYNDTEVLYRTLNGVRVDDVEEKVMYVIINRSNAQRQLIKQLYEELYETDIVIDITHRLFGDFRKVMLGLMISSKNYYAHELYMATIGIGTDEKAITEILTPMTASEISNVKAAYEEDYGKSLRDALVSDTSGVYKDFLISLCDSVRVGHEKIDRKAAHADARTLIKAIGGQKNESNYRSIIEIFTKRSFSHMRVTFKMYEKILSKDLMQSINYHFTGDLQYALQTTVAFLFSSPSSFYARLLNDAILGIGTNDLRLIRIFIARSEIDLKDIRNAYTNLFGCSLAEDVIDDTSGFYQKALINLLMK